MRAPIQHTNTNIIDTNDITHIAITNTATPTHTHTHIHTHTYTHTTTTTTTTTGEDVDLEDYVNRPDKISAAEIR